MISFLKVLVGGLIGGLVWAAPARAGDIAVAVAANFTAPAKQIAARFEAETGRVVDLSFGASGQLFAQISQGAPFDILLSADSARAKMAEEGGWAVAGTRFTYAIGKLALWSATPGYVDAMGEVLQTGQFAHLAVANPEAAPYGAAAMATLKALGLDERLRPRIVQGETIAQTFQFVASGNAELGFVALSQIVDRGKDAAGSLWMVPETLYPAIRQDAVLLSRAQEKAVARAFIAFLQGPEAVGIIERYGYGTVPRH